MTIKAIRIKMYQVPQQQCSLQTFKPFAITDFCDIILLYMYIRMHHECEVWIEKSVPMIPDWHHEACQVMITSGH